jgi:CubicO group peptidase (beta-lactamase class C family)
MRLIRLALGAALTLAAGVGIAQQAKQPAPALVPAPMAALPGSGGVVAPQPDGRRALTKEDADVWLDGLMPYALQRGDIAGAVVVIVKDGQVLTQRGFGYSDVAARKPVDPATTLFRPGSVSKLYTWTSVMQLVEAGKIDLDADVNTYLDFKIPPYQGKPITMRNIMTHTPGFEEAGRDLIVDKGPTPSLEATVKRWTPHRVYAPGSTPAYSNYATAIAGYIVQRVSGMPYDDYIERNIFQRLGMTHASFRQPLPAALQPFMSKGYQVGSGEAKPYELVAMAPAGSSAISGADMGKFMIAHLADGGPLLRPETTKLMHSPANEPIPGLNRMMLGFYEQKINGQSAIAHGGDTGWFHSNLVLFPQEKAGIYISANSVGKDGAIGPIRTALFKEFADRYFPGPKAAPPKELATAKEHAAMVAGTYASSRGAVDNFAAMLGLVGQLKVTTDKDGKLSLKAFTTLGGAPHSWVEVAPFIWQSPEDGEKVGAQVVDGKVVRIAYDPIAPIMVFDRVPWHKDTAWLLPMFIISLIVIALTALSWPVAAITRRRYGATFALTGKDRSTYRVVRLFAWLAIAVPLGWIALIGMAFDGITPASLIWCLEIIGTLVFPGLLGLAVWNAMRTFKGGRGWFAKLWSVLLVIAAFFVLWVAVVFNLISFGANF